MPRRATAAPQLPRTRRLHYAMGNMARCTSRASQKSFVRKFFYDAPFVLLLGICAGGAGGSDGDRQHAHLLDYAKRLEVELRAYQARYPTVPLDEAELEDAKTDAVPPWVSAPDALSPLLAAYDERIAELETANKRHADAVRSEGRAVAAARSSCTLAAHGRGRSSGARARPHTRPTGGPLPGASGER